MRVNFIVFDNHDRITHLKSMNYSFVDSFKRQVELSFQSTFLTHVRQLVTIGESKLIKLIETTQMSYHVGSNVTFLHYVALRFAVFYINICLQLKMCNSVHIIEYIYTSPLIGFNNIRNYNYLCKISYKHQLNSI